MKPFLWLTVYIFFVWFQYVYSEPLNIEVNAKGAILMNAETGAILYEKNARDNFYPASITKIATLLYALKLKGDHLNEEIIVEGDDIGATSEEAMRKSNYTLPPYWLTFGGTHMGLRKGEKLTFQDLLYGMMLVSANDASNVVARVSAGSVSKFMLGLNAYLKGINCQKTHFENPHGLFHPNHQTTPYEMALITREALKISEFCKIIATPHYPRPKTNKQESYLMAQGNKLMRKGRFKYSKAIGGKTGYHSQAEHTFSVAATHEERTLIAVLMKTKDRSEMFSDAIKLFESAFNQTKVNKVYFKSGSQSFEIEVKGANKKIQTYLDNALSLSYYPAEEPQVKCFIEWDDVHLPINKGQRVGVIKLQSLDGKDLAISPLLSENDVSQTWFDWICRLMGL